MKKKRIAKVAGILLVLFLCVMYLTDILAMKWRYPCYESIVPTRFYDLDKNSVEVCVLGSSQVVYGISGMELYGEYGISAYSLGTALQPIEASYTWLQECNKTQDIKLLVFDVSMLFEYSDEARYRQAYDNMKLSLTKLKAVWEHCQESSTADPFISYIFKIVKYHNRWSELEKDDFTIQTQDHPIFRGNYAYALSDPVNIDKVAYDNDGYDPSLTMNPDQLKYFEMILDYCENEDIEVLLIKTPKSSWSLTKHMLMEEYVEEHGLTFLEFSSMEMMEKLGIDPSRDFRDSDHLNLIGAQKLSRYLGAYIKENYELTDFRKVEGYDDQNYGRYLERMEDSKVQLATNVTEYFEYLNNPRYEAVLQVTGDPSGYYTEELAAAMKAAGLTVNLNELGGQRYSAWLKAGKCQYETTSLENLEYTDRFADGIGFRTFSNYDSDSTCRMRVNYENHVFQNRGLNILVYDVENHSVVDKSTVYYDALLGAPVMQKNNAAEYATR